MSKYLVFLFFGVSGFVQAQSICSEAWYQAIDKKLPTADTQGHGPDIGSDEWKSVIEFKLGVRGGTSVPERSSEKWCNFVDQRTNAILVTGCGTGKSLTTNVKSGPSYDCAQVEP
ncbi:hypothetical protein [Pseudomonas sputi]|uniref:hypothetical protein n=1 Tax=Pseudomonas sputi TaxID=2892325 RepID=UPI001F169AFB|nr:hypothetical protein [Pseudomonas sputi]